MAEFKAESVAYYDTPELRARASFHLLAKDLSEMVLAYDMQRRLLFVNAAAQTLTGYSVEELEAAQFICWIHPEDRERMLRMWDRLFHGKFFYEEEYRLITKDGRIKWAVASWAPILDDDGKQVGVQGRERDITQRKMAEATLRHSEATLRADQERYRALFENSPFPMWEEDFSEVKLFLDALVASGVTNLRAYFSDHPEVVLDCIQRVRILDVNHAARDFYQASTKEDLLGGLEKLFDERAFAIFGEELATLAETSSFRTEFPAQTLRGEERLADVIVSIVESSRDDWSRVIVSFFDITDRKRLEEQLVQSQKMESLGRLAGGIAHDFNNLLTVINGYSDWILQNMGPDERWRKGLEEIRGAGEQCANLTSQLLAFSRKQVRRRQPMDLNRLIVESQGVFQRVMGDDVELRTSLTPELGAIEADRGEILQVLLNLMANAREAMPHGGTVRIETRNVRLSPDFQEQEEGATFALLAVHDTGFGMDERTKRLLFEPFFTTKKDQRNTGLGLATVFGIVTHSGGHIGVSSEPGEGSLFKIYLPVVQAPVAVDIQEPVIAAGFRGSGTVLLVDDRADVRGVARSMLESVGYHVLEASGGEQALHIAGQQAAPIDLILTDIVMPGIDGAEVVERLMPLRPQMKIIFMSGYPGRVPLHPASVAYLQKPFTRAKLIEVLRQVME